MSPYIHTQRLIQGADGRVVSVFSAGKQTHFQNDSWKLFEQSFSMVVLIRCSICFSVSIISRACPIHSHGEPLPALWGPHWRRKALLWQKMVNLIFNLQKPENIDVLPLDGNIAMGWMTLVFERHFIISLVETFFPPYTKIYFLEASLEVLGLDCIWTIAAFYLNA